jgi:hypothetical protein
MVELAAATAVVVAVVQVIWRRAEASQPLGRALEPRGAMPSTMAATEAQAELDPEQETRRLAGRSLALALVERLREAEQSVPLTGATEPRAKSSSPTVELQWSRPTTPTI